MVLCCWIEKKGDALKNLSRDDYFSPISPHTVRKYSCEKTAVWIEDFVLINESTRFCSDKVAQESPDFFFC